MEEIPMAMKKSVVLPFVRSAQKLELFTNALGKPPVPHVFFLSYKNFKVFRSGEGYVYQRSFLNSSWAIIRDVNLRSAYFSQIGPKRNRLHSRAKTRLQRREQLLASLHFKTRSGNLWGWKAWNENQSVLISLNRFRSRIWLGIKK